MKHSSSCSVFCSKYRKELLIGAGIFCVLIVVAGIGMSLTSPKPVKIVKPTPPPITLTEEQKQELKAGKEDHKPQNLSFHVVAGNNSFVPNEIEVKKDDIVRILFTAKEGSYNFILPEYNVVLPPTAPGRNMAIEFKADKVGTFTFSSFKTDPKKPTMTGKLIVK